MSQRVLLHIIGWVIFIVYGNYKDYSKPEDFVLEWIWVDATYNLSLIGTFYFLYSFIYPRLLKQRQWVPLAFGILASLLFFCGLRFFLHEVVSRLVMGFGNYNPKLLTLSYYISDNWFRPIPIVIASAIIYLFEAHNKNQKEQQLLQQEKTAAELAFLRGQVNPHFLFNTLHLLHTEAFEKDPALAATILQVSDILRYSVDSAKAEKRTIGQEINLMENYIDIFKKRFENRCFINFEVIGHEKEQLIEPLLLIPFVENALKHGIFSDPKNPIEIILNLEQGKLFFQTSNLIKRQTKDASSGVGIENVRRRLNVLYADKHDFQIKETVDTYEINLSLQL